MKPLDLFVWPVASATQSQNWLLSSARRNTMITPGQHYPPQVSGLSHYGYLPLRRRAGSVAKQEGFCLQASSVDSLQFKTWFPSFSILPGLGLSGQQLQGQTSLTSGLLKRQGNGSDQCQPPDRDMALQEGQRLKPGHSQMLCKVLLPILPFTWRWNWQRIKCEREKINACPTQAPFPWEGWSHQEAAE